MTEIFPIGYPLRDALHIEGDELREIAAEIELKTTQGEKRVSVSVQAIQEDGERMGALVTLADLDSPKVSIRNSRLANVSPRWDASRQASRTKSKIRSTPCAYGSKI